MDLAALAEVPLFADLSPERRAQLAVVCTELELEAGTTIVSEGDFGFAMFVVKAGAADVVQDETLLRTLGPGDVFGEIAILSGGRRTATVVARSQMRLISVFNRDVWRLEREAPEVGSALRAVIADCLESSP